MCCSLAGGCSAGQEIPTIHGTQMFITMLRREEPATRPYPELDESSPHQIILYYPYSFWYYSIYAYM
jgi:hypothetical protein